MLSDSTASKSIGSTLNKGNFPFNYPVPYQRNTVSTQTYLILTQTHLILTHERLFSTHKRLFSTHKRPFSTQTYLILTQTYLILTHKRPFLIYNSDVAIQDNENSLIKWKNRQIY